MDDGVGTPRASGGVSAKSRNLKDLQRTSPREPGGISGMEDVRKAYQ